MIRPMFLKLFAIAGLAAGLLAKAPQAEAAQNFQLHFRCSPWLYMSEVTGGMRRDWERSRGTVMPMDMDAVNRRLCTQNAERITYATNMVFALNGIPAVFSYTTEVVAGGPSAALGLKYRVALVDSLARSNASALINSRNPFPDLYVHDVDIVRDVDQSTCNPWQSGTAECASLVAATCPDNATANNPFVLCKNAAGGSVFARISPFISGITNVGMLHTDHWNATTAVGGARKINVAVRWLPSPDNKLGLVRGVYVRASTALSLNGGTLTKRALTPSNYLPTVGIATVIAGGPSSVFNLAAAPHEIGHVFGALHQRSAVQADTLFYSFAELESGYQFANSNTTGQSYSTLMVNALTADVRLNFSTTYVWKGPPQSCPPGKTCPPSGVRIGDALTDNRRYIFETIQWITGDTSLTMSSPTQPANNVLERVLP